MKEIPNDFGAHQRLSSSGLLHASNTMRAGPLKVRATTSSRSDFRSTFVLFFMRISSFRFSFLTSIKLFLLFQFLNNVVEFVETCVPELAVVFDPQRLFFEA